MRRSRDRSRRACAWRNAARPDVSRGHARRPCSPSIGHLAVDVADGDELHPLVVQERLDVVEALVPRPDHRNGDPIAGRDPCAQPQRACRHDRGKRQAGCHAWKSCAQKITARVFRGHRLLLVHQDDSCARGGEILGVRCRTKQASCYHRTHSLPTIGRFADCRNGLGLAALPFLLAMGRDAEENQSPCRTRTLNPGQAVPRYTKHSDPRREA